MIIGYQTKFDAAHFLPGHPECGVVHGHTWTVEAQISGAVDTTTGMVEDFTKLKTNVKTVLEPLDHRLINDTIQIPTCENVVRYIRKQLFAIYSLRCYSVKVQEGDGGWAIHEG